MKRQRVIYGLIIGVAVLIVATTVCIRTAGTLLNRATGEFSKPNNAIEVSLVYAPEEELYIRNVITDFNRSFAQGRNPVTGKDLASGERPIWVEGKNGSSGTVAQGIINAYIAPNNANVERPIVFSTLPVIPVAYGSDADINSLSSIARAPDTKVQSGDPKNIKNLLEVIGSYF